MSHSMLRSIVISWKKRRNDSILFFSLGRGTLVGIVVHKLRLDAPIER